MAVKLTAHLREIIRTINDLTISGGMPSWVGIHTGQHDHVASKSNGDFLMTVESVPCFVDTATASAGNPAYKISEGTATTLVVAADTGDAGF